MSTYDPGNNFIDIKGYVDTLAHISEEDRDATVMSEHGRIGYQDKGTTYNTAYTTVWRSRFITTQVNSSFSEALERGGHPDIGSYNNSTYQIKFLYVNFLEWTINIAGNFKIKLYCVKHHQEYEGSI